MDDIFHNLSRIVIFLPIVIVIIALMVKFSQQTSPLTFNNREPSISVMPTSTPINNILEVLKTSTGQAILKGDKPMVCQFRTAESSISAFVNKKTILAERNKEQKTVYYLYQGDCFYQWEKEKYSGDKICGLSPYVSLLDKFGQFNIINNLPFINHPLVKEVAETLKTCKTGLISKDKSFTVPPNVLFKNKELGSLMK